MSIKTKLLAVSGSLTGMVSKVYALNNEEVDISLTPDTAKGMENLAQLPYIDKLKWIIDTVYALVPYIAILAIGWLALKYYFAGWDSVENEIKTRKGFFSILAVILILKVGSALVAIFSNW
jgi:hypothetical protein